MNPFRIERAASDMPGRAKLKKASTNREARGEAIADRELTEAELASVSAAGNSDLSRAQR